MVKWRIRFANNIGKESKERLPPGDGGQIISADRVRKGSRGDGRWKDLATIFNRRMEVGSESETERVSTNREAIEKLLNEIHNQVVVSSNVKANWELSKRKRKKKGGKEKDNKNDNDAESDCQTIGEEDAMETEEPIDGEQDTTLVKKPIL